MPDAAQRRARDDREHDRARHRRVAGASRSARRAPVRPRAAAGTIEELLRYLSIADIVPSRLAVQDSELSGTRIRAGEGVFALLAAADWDPEVFPEPDRLDLRHGDRHHVAFGYGVHQCIGQNLARLGLEIAFAALFDRIPTLRRATPADELPYQHGGLAYGLEALPVTW